MLAEYCLPLVKVGGNFLAMKGASGEEELTAALKEIIARVGATSAKEMGKVMGTASKELAGKAEGKAISAKVRELLA